ncbi:type II toxin-antitoxin system Phd/YefM family antitoxin [Thermodesulfobacteriota bacterium]
MLQINVKDARNNLSSLLDRVAAGEEIIITRRGKQVAKMVRPRVENHLPNLDHFRSSLKIDGKPMSQEVVDARREERY